MKNKSWEISDILYSTFKKVKVTKRSNSPILFNLYSNTKAAPFTSEKTQIPLSHKIGSFNSISIQNLVIDKTTKMLKALSDEYFIKHKIIVLPRVASEFQEYLYHSVPKQNYEEYKVYPEQVELRKTSYQKYLNFINEFVKDSFVANIKDEWLVNIVKMCIRAYNLVDQQHYSNMLNDCLKEINSIYKFSMKKSIVDYLLKHPEQREKLGIPIPFRKLKEYGEERIERPSDDNWDWKRQFNLSKLRISTNLMIMNQNITKIMKYYVNKLQLTSFVDLPVAWSKTSNIIAFKDRQLNQIEQQKKIVTEEWKGYVEGILKENKIYKDQLILYFKSVSGLMSSQLREMIIKSLSAYHSFISGFRREVYFTPEEVFKKQFSTEFDFQKSFLEVEIINDNDEFSFSDKLDSIRNSITETVSEIVKSSHEVERPDNMFIKNLEKRKNLWQIAVNDVEVSFMQGDIDLILSKNLQIINKCLGIYDPFKFVLTETSALEKFKSNSPSREEIKEKIHFYEEKLKKLRE